MRGRAKRLGPGEKSKELEEDRLGLGEDDKEDSKKEKK